MITLVLLGLLLIPFLLVGGGMAIFWRRNRRRILRWTAIGYGVTTLVILFGVGPYLTAWLLTNARTRPPDRQLKDTPADHGVAYEDIVFDARDSIRLSGWFIPPTGKDAILICTHGLFRNRVEVLGRIMPVAQAGYGALLYDSRSHGGSDTGLVSLGYHERNDVLGAVQYVQRRYQDSLEHPGIVLMGVSMGAVATLEAAADSSTYSALILDSPFSRLRDTVEDHSWLFLKMPRFPFPSLFLFWFERLAGFDPDRVDSLQAIRRVEPVPLLLIASEGDLRISDSVSRALFDQSPARIKELKVFGRDVPHGASARVRPDEYTRVLLSFLEKALAEETAEETDGDPSTYTTSRAGSPR